MLTFIIGSTGFGKSQMAKTIAGGRKVISAGRWIREKTGIFDHGEKESKALSSESQKILKENPLAAAEWISSQIPEDRNVVIEGIRNPLDLLFLVRKGDHIINLGFSPSIDSWETRGLKVITSEPFHSWLMVNYNISWTNYFRTFANLPEPLPVFLHEEWLFDRDSTKSGRFVSGHILSLESYKDQKVTAMFKSQEGGTFHDLPLEAFETHFRSGYCDHFTEDSCYSPADRGPMNIELPPSHLLSNHCKIFNRNKEKVGDGKLLYCVHWPQGNTLLYLVQAGSDLLLWPPHKLLIGKGSGDVLPEWKKLHHEGNSKYLP